MQSCQSVERIRQSAAAG